MKRNFLVLVIILLAAVVASGCTTTTTTTEDNGTYVIPQRMPEWYNNSNYTGSNSTVIGDKPLYIFRLYQDSFVMKANRSISFPIIFENADDYNETHNYTARFIPDSVDFDVKAAYQCLNFNTCEKLIQDMESYITHNTSSIEIAPGFVGVHEVTLALPNSTAIGVYVYRVVGCKDVPYDKCDRSTANFGPVLTFSVEVVEQELVRRNYS
jgi:hypothetical protein